ncbi:hypothetical protein [Flavobacterium daemonense]|uniref:hypothetical protein n=1 Tax=Flavobacterium daemonense TaxID=1393049 RepID=UPI001184E6C9|nr:hypothetical protein [Flavobacterium daemonense]KAF2331334.1 hypothetical protein FND99_13895 [Flavobacterium daemonense]
MKRFKLKSVLVVLFLSTALISCSNDDDHAEAAVKTKTAFVTKIEGPATGKVNDELSYDVTFTVDNACGEFDKIAETTIGETKGLEVVAKYPVNGVCTQQIPDPKKTVYKFKATAKGTFDIKFRKSETEFLTQKVVIE